MSNTSALRLSPLIVGCWQLDDRIWKSLAEADVARALDMYLALGVDTFDTADSYGRSEEILGRLLKGRECRILTKVAFFTPNPTPIQVRQKVENALRTLRRDYLDSVQVHWQQADADCSSTFAVLQELQAQGKIHHIGVANFSTAMLEKALNYAPLSTHQVQYSLIDRRVEQSMQSLCLQHHIELIAYGPLAGGYLSNRFSSVAHPRGESDHARGFYYSVMIESHGGWGSVSTLLERLVPLAARSHKTVAQVALAWVYQQAGVTAVISGLTLDRQRIQENVAAMQWQMDPEDLQLLSAWSDQLFKQEGDVYSYERQRY